MQLTFAGATRQVTGSCYHLKTETANFLVDCGLFQGGKVAEEQNNEEFPFDPKAVDFVILTHAHLDHCGRLPLLYKRGFRGTIYAVEPTIPLSRIVLDDAAGLIAEEASRDNEKPLFTEDDIPPLFDHFEACTYHKPVTVKGITFTFVDAGHILGSASVLIKTEKESIAFSGDLGNPPTPLLNPTEFIQSADYVVMESTYGNRRHEDFHLRQQRLMAAIRNSVAQGGVLLIPSFAIERSQEILHDINLAIEKGKLPYFPMYLDSPMAIEATDIYRQFSHYYNQSAVKELTVDQDLFSFPGLTMTKTTDESKSINAAPPPKVIMAGSGMMHGGRILHHLRQYLHNPRCTVLIVGFLVENSVGRRLLDGEHEITIMGEKIHSKAKIEAIGAFSGHADQPKLLEWIGHYSPHPKHIFVTHGEEQSALDFAESIKSTITGSAVDVPYQGDTVTLT